MVHISPIFLAPYFRHFCPEFDKNKGTSPRGLCVPGYLSSCVFCAVLSTLFAVAVDMSDPWDGVGADDLHFLLDTEIEEATRAQHHAFHPTTGEVQFVWTARVPPPKAREPLQLRRRASTHIGRVVATPEGSEDEADAQAPAGGEHESLLV
jgi:hypothetical protein